MLCLSLLGLLGAPDDSFFFSVPLSLSPSVHFLFPFIYFIPRFGSSIRRLLWGLGSDQIGSFDVCWLLCMERWLDGSVGLYTSALHLHYPSSVLPAW